MQAICIKALIIYGCVMVQSWCSDGAVENKSGQQLAAISPVFCVMILGEDCVQNVSDVGE